MALAVKPNSVTFTFYDNNGVLLYDKEYITDGARDLPGFERDSTLEVYDTVASKRYLGIIYDVQLYIEIDNANMPYKTYVRCKNSHAT
jgi:hypothetical protein